MAIRYPTNYDKIADIPADLEDMAESIQDELDLKVDKATGKSLSTNDYTDDEKSKLAGIATGAEVNVIETVKVNGTVLTPSNKAVDVSVPTKTSDLSNDSGFIDKDVNNLTNYYDKNAVDTKISAVYKYKGTVSTYNDLPSTDLTVGDVYNIETADSTHGIKAGDNVAWNGSTWDVLAGTVDLSGYQTKIDSSHKLASDLVDDTNSTHKFVTSEEKTQISTNATDIDNIKDGTEIDSFGDVETVLAEKQEQIDELVEENSTLKKQIPTAHISTTSTQLTDSAEDLPIEHVKLKGQTSQEQYEGYNLWGGFSSYSFSNKGIDFVMNNDGSISMSGTSTDGNATLSITSAVTNGVSVTLPAGTYTISKDVINSGFAIQVYSSTSDYIIQITNSNYSSQFTLSEETTVVVRAAVLNTNTTLDLTVKVMLEPGSTAHDWEPYVGGQPAPNPAYPQLIHRVTGDCNAKVQNKNEFDIDDFYENCITVRCTKETIDNGIRLNFSNNSIPYVGETVSVGNIASQTIQNMMQRIDGNINYTISSSSRFLKCYITFFDKNYKSLQRKDMINISSLTFTTPENAEYFCLRLGLAENDTASITSYDYTNIQLEKSSIATDYIPHAEQNAPLSLGNIEAYEGDEIEIDYVQKAGYKKVTGARFVQNMRTKIFSGNNTENWILQSINSYGIANFYIAVNDYIGTDDNLGLTNYFSPQITSIVNEQKQGFRLNMEKRLYIRVDSNTANTVESFNTWLSTHNLKLIYKLATPVITPITDPTLLAQFETLINMKTYKDITNIDCTGEDLAPVLDCDYYQDMSTLNDRLDELEARIELLEE